MFRQFLNRQYLRLLNIEKELSTYQDYIGASVKSNDTCQRLITMPSVGSIVIISLTSWTGDGYQFKRGRDASACFRTNPPSKQHWRKMLYWVLVKHFPPVLFSC